MIFTYLGAFIGFVNTIILFPMFLTTEQIGLLKILPNAALLIVPFAQLGMGQVLQKFAPEMKKKDNGLTQLLSLCVVFALGGFLATACILLSFDSFFASFFNDNSPLFINYFFVTIILILLFSITSLYEIYSRLFLKIIVQNIIKEVLIRVLIAISVTLYFTKIISFHEMVIGLILVFGLALVALLSYIYALGELKFSLRFNQVDSSFLKKIALYGLFVILGASSSGIVLNIDQLMISSYLSLSANGIYSIVFYFAVMIELPKRAISQITAPLIANSLEDQNISEIEKIYQQTSINQMAVGFLFFIGLICNLDNLFSLMANGSVYATGKYVVYFIGFAKLIDMAFSNGSSIISLSQYYKFNVITIVLLAVTMLGFNMLLIPAYGISGAAFASMMALAIFAIIKMIFIKIKFNILPFTWKNFHLLIIGSIILVVGFWLPISSNTIFDIIFRSSLITILFCGSIYLFKISKEINGTVDMLWMKFRGTKS